MSHPLSKFETVLESVREETREACVPASGGADALRVLRSSKPSVRTKRWGLRYAPVSVVVLGIAIAAIMWPRPTAAARLISILSKKVEGIVGQRVTYEWKGEASECQTFSDGATVRIINPDGSEQKFENGRAFRFDPQGFIEITAEDNGAEGAQAPELAKLVATSRNGQVSRELLGERELFRVQDKVVDAQGVSRKYKAIVTTDPEGRVHHVDSALEGLGKTQIRFDYQLSPSKLELPKVEEDRVYDLDLQRGELVKAMRAMKARPTESAPAFLDEHGWLAAIVPVQDVLVLQDHMIDVAGQLLPAENLAFNVDVRTPLGIASAPVKFEGHSYLLKTARVNQVPSVPFKMQFPVWRYSPAYHTTHPVLRPDDRSRIQFVGNNGVWIRKVERTSNIIHLLCPNNRPFFYESQKEGGPARPGN